MRVVHPVTRIDRLFLGRSASREAAEIGMPPEHFGSAVKRVKSIVLSSVTTHENDAMKQCALAGYARMLDAILQRSFPRSLLYTCKVAPLTILYSRGPKNCTKWPP